MFHKFHAVKIFIMMCFGVWRLAYPANLALRKPAIQSSTWYDMAAGRAVDGERNGYESSCSHTTGRDLPAWWIVDLMGVYLVKYVVIYNRNTFQERLDNLHVEGFLHYPLLCSQAVRKLCAHHLSPSGAVVNLTCSQKVRARYIRLINTAPLHVCEVEVYGEDDQECRKRTVHFEEHDGRILVAPVLDLGHASSSRDCSYLCLQRPDCHVYNYNNVTGECRVPESLSKNISSTLNGWTLNSIC